jgi:hypothetical protein
MIASLVVLAVMAPLGFEDPGVELLIIISWRRFITPAYSRADLPCSGTLEHHLLVERARVLLREPTLSEGVHLLRGPWSACLPMLLTRPD